MFHRRFALVSPHDPLLMYCPLLSSVQCSAPRGPFDSQISSPHALDTLTGTKTKPLTHGPGLTGGRWDPAAAVEDRGVA